MPKLQHKPLVNKQWIENKDFKAITAVARQMRKVVDLIHREV